MIGEIFWYTGLSLMMLGIGLSIGEQAKSHKIMVFYSLLFLPILLVEPLLSPFSSIFPPTLSYSAMVNTLEFSAVSLGYAIGFEFIIPKKKRLKLNE